jgi:hypothetical protein
MRTRSQRIVSGLSLIVAGLALYVLRGVEGFGQAAVFLVLGVVFLAAYFSRRAYGFLVPGCILVGLGAGLLLDEGRVVANGLPLGLGLGFVAVFVIAWLYQRSSHWWPLVPGVALILLAVPHAERVVTFLVHNWPLILVAVGLLVLLGALRPTSSRS